MADDLPRLLGDHGTAAPVVVSPAFSATVTRRGERVLLTIGNADPIRLSYKESMVLGQKLMNEGHTAHRRKERVEIGFEHHALVVSGRSAFRVGHQLLVRGTEVKYLVSDRKRLLMEPGQIGLGLAGRKANEGAKG